MELQDNPDSDVKAVRAQSGATYPIRMLHLTNGMLVVGFVIEVFPETIFLLRPHFLRVDYDSDKENIDGYDFEPYLNQLAKYDPNGLDPTPFVMNNVISVNFPADHIVKNYESITMIKSMIAIDPESVKVTRRNYLTTNPVN